MASSTSPSPLQAEDLLESLTRVLDPEMGINIVDLGLVYGIDLVYDVGTIQMTLRDPDSPVREIIEQDVQQTLLKRHPELTAVNVEFVWDPVWGEHFMTEEGQRQLASPITRRIATPDNPLTHDDIVDTLHHVLDPEVGINIIDLGLVYGIGLRDGAVTIQMTMTTPSCPLQATLEGAVNRTMQTRHPEITDVTIDVVWDPPWGVERISPEGRRQLGW